MKKKRTCVYLLVLFMIVNLCAPMGNILAKDISSNEHVTVFACGDYQHPSGNSASAGVVNNILAQIELAGYEDAYGFLGVGDYDYEYTETTEGITSLTQTVRGRYSSIKEDKMFFVQGNHDVAGATGLSNSGANDTEYYGVYVIHEDDYPEGGGEEAGVKNVASALDDYLQAKEDTGNKKPIFIISHLPLHYTMRTNGNGDALYGKYLFDVMNEHASAGQTIIYLYGHNHNSYGFDDYIGGSAVYLTQGDTIYLAQPGNKTAQAVGHELQFTYLNAGYVGYNYSENAGADKALTMTVFDIVGNNVKIERYSADGIHNLKSEGRWSSKTNESKDKYGATDAYLLSTYASPQIIGNKVIDSNIEVAASGLTEITVSKSVVQRDDAVHTAYVAYNITPTGYADGDSAIVKIRLPEEFDVTQPIYVIDKSTDSIICEKIKDGAVTYITDHLGAIELSQFKSISSFENKEIVYRPVSQVASDKSYIITNSDSVGSSVALKNSVGAEVSSANIQIESDILGAYIKTDDSSLIWNWVWKLGYGSPGAGWMQNQATNQKLYAGNGSVASVTENQEDYIYWKMSSSGTGLYAIQNWDNRDGARYYLQYDGGFTVGSGSASKRVYLFEESVVTTTDSVSMDSVKGRVPTQASENAKTGSKIIFFSEAGEVEIIDVTLEMLRDAQGNAVSVANVATQEHLSIYYNDTLVYDDYTLEVCHQNGWNYMNVVDYRSGDVYSYPEERGYVFAGWYEDAEFSKPLSKTEKTGYAYAKFVDANVLSVKCQITEGTTNESKDTDLRMLTSVDSLDYATVGFAISIGNQSTTRTSNTVYESIIGYEDGAGRAYLPTVFAETSQYFMAYQLTDIANAYYTTSIVAKPMWTTLDGTTVFGVERALTVNQIAEASGSTDTITVGNGEYTTYVSEVCAKKGQVVNFDIELSPAQTYNLYILENSQQGATYEHVILNQSGDKQRVAVVLNHDIDNLMIRTQITDWSYEISHNLFTISNIEISHPAGNIVGAGVATSAFNLSGKKGQIVSFDVESSKAKDITLFVLEDGEWGVGTAEHNCSVSGLSGKRTIEVELYEDITSFIVWAQVTDTSADMSDNVIAITNAQIKNPSGTITGSGPAVYTFNLSGTAGQTLSFTLDMSHATSMKFYVLENGEWGEYEHFFYFDSWSGERTLNVLLKHDVSSIVFWTQMYGSNNMSENELRMSNVEVK